MPLFEGNLFTLPFSENPESLSHLALNPYRVVTPQTDGQTDRIPIANTHSQQYLPVQMSRVKKEGKMNCEIFTPITKSCV